MINRHAMITTPKQPLIDWAKAVDGGFDGSDDEIVEMFTTVFLLDYHEQGVNQSDLSKLAKKYYREIFEQELSTWSTNQDAWPQITLANFNLWFELKIIEEVWDLGTKVAVGEEE